MVQLDADTCSLQIPYWVDAPKWSAEPGETFSAVWGSGYERARAFVQIEHRGKILQEYWTDSDQTQARIEQEVTEDMRGGFRLHVTMVRENRVCNTKRMVNVPWSNKELTVEWQTFRSKLGPAEEETWTAIIKGPNAEPAAAEFAATLYDASLDTFAPHTWSARIGAFHNDSSTLTIPGHAVRPAMGEITVSKETKGTSWGGVHWQYFESVDKITPHEGNPLSLKKTLYIQRDSKKSPVLHKLADSALNVGDKLVVRIELRTGRDMEFVHLKDQRGSGTEPVNVLSRHRYRDGLRYYESTKDTATHFYIEHLPKGTYVFEYPVRVQHRGEYQSGIAHIECLYAPEFNSHSESTPIQVTGSNSEKSH